MNSHSDIRTLLSGYCGDDLPASERTAVEEHLKLCPDCRAELLELQTTLRVIRTTPGIEPPPWLTTRIMAHVREEQAEKQGWLKRLFFPLRIKIPLELTALLVVCLCGYYLTRTVETELRSPQMLQDAPAPASAPRVERKPDMPKEKPILPEPSRTKTAPIAPPVQSPPASREESVQHAAPQTFAPAPPALKREQPSPSGGSDAVRSESIPADKTNNRAMEAAPVAKKKSARGEMRFEPGNVNPGAASKATARAVKDKLPQMTLRLDVSDKSSAARAIRLAASRSGAGVVDEFRHSSGRLTLKIPAARFEEFCDRLALIGHISEQPEPPLNVQMLEVTILW